MTCPLCGAQNNPSVAACYNCGGALAQTFVQPQQQWAQQPAQPAQQQWAPQQPAQQQWAQQPAQPAPQQWAPQQSAQPAPVMTPDAGMGFDDQGFGGAVQPSSWDAGISYDSSGQGGGGSGKRLKIVAVSVIGLLLVGGGTVGGLWAFGVIWSDGPEGEWIASDGETVEFQEDGDVESTDMSGFNVKWEVDGDQMIWTFVYDSGSGGTPMFQCDDGTTIPLDWVNDDEIDCDGEEDEGLTQSEIDRNTVYEESSSGVGFDEMKYTMKYEIIDDVMFFKPIEMKVTSDGETVDVTDEILEESDGECIAFVRKEVAKTAEEWKVEVNKVNIPGWCDSVAGFVDENEDQGPDFYSFQFTPIDDGNGETYSKLLYITLNSAPTSEELNIYDSHIRISVEGGMPYYCQEDELAEYCYWERQSATDDGDSIWDEDETFEIYRGEGMESECGVGCVIDISIINIDGMTLATGQVTLN